MFGKYLLCLIHAEHHKSGGVGICCGTILCYDGGGKNAVLYRITRVGVNGVGILLAILLVVVAIVA